MIGTQSYYNVYEFNFSARHEFMRLQNEGWDANYGYDPELKVWWVEAFK